RPPRDLHSFPTRRSSDLVSGLFFFPRGGSAQVARGLGRALAETGWEVTLAAGSLGQAGEQTHAPTFFGGLDVVTVDYSPGSEGRSEEHTSELQSRFDLVC